MSRTRPRRANKELSDLQLIRSAIRSARANGIIGDDKLPARSHTTVIASTPPCAWCKLSIQAQDAVSTVFIAGARAHLHHSCASNRHLRLLGAV
jgi:hypothetical protein